MQSLSDLEDLHDRWLMRYGVADAYARWREADGVRAPKFAFTAIACDARLLLRLAEGVATDIASQAERMALEVEQAASCTEAARAAVTVVRGRVSVWRKYMSSSRRRHDGNMPSYAAVSERAPERTRPVDEQLKAAILDFPHMRGFYGRALSATVLRLGADGLARLGAPADVVLAMTGARFAARCWRVGFPHDGLSQPECLQTIAIIQDWSLQTGKNPFVLAYEHRRVSPDDAPSLAFDASTCLAIAEALPEGADAPGFGMWEAAEEFHAFAVMVVRPRVLKTMEWSKAQSFASAAARQAQAALDDPGLRLPEFPNSDGRPQPRCVLAATRFAIPDGPLPRRTSTIKPVDATLLPAGDRRTNRLVNLSR